MTLTTLLSTIISIAFLYSVLALFTSELQEYLATIFEARAKRLKQSIRQMLGEQDWPFYQLVNEGENIAKDSKIYLKDGKIQPLKQGQTSIYFNSQDQEFDESQVIEKPLNSGNFILKTASNSPNKDEIVIKYSGYTVLETISEKSNYWLDVVTKEILDQKNQPMVKDILVDSLTEMLYQHRNIKALNQSGFAWFSLVKDPKSVFCFIINLLSLIGVAFSLYFNKSQYLLLGLFIFALTLLIFTIYYLKGEDKGKIRNEDKIGTIRKSVGPSYIEAELFARTLIDIISRNTMNITDNELRLNTLFYTPAKSILGEMLKKVESELGNENQELSPEQLITELTKRYQNGFEEVQERSSGVYKRNAKGLSFLLGLLIAIFLNVDTLYLVIQLTQSNDQTTQTIVTQLEKKQTENPEFFEKCPKDNPNCLEDKLTQLGDIYGNINNLPLGWGLNSESEDQNVPPQQNAILQENQEKINLLSRVIDTFNFGYFQTSETENDNQCDQTNFNKLELQKACFNAVEKQLITVGIDNTKTDILFVLTPDFKNSILAVRNPDGTINNDQLSKFIQSYESFMNQQYQDRSKLIVNLKNDPIIDPIGLTEQIKTTVENQGGWWKVFLGWLITAIAISMGAPFWFDLLSRLMNVRNTKKEDPANNK